MPNDLPDWTRQVQVEAGTIDATITGPVTVKGTVNVAKVAALTKITDPVSVSGPITVEGVATGTTIGVAGTIDIGSGTVDIGTVTGAVSVENVVDTVIKTGDTVTLVTTGHLVTFSGTLGISAGFSTYHSAGLLVLVAIGSGTPSLYCCSAKNGLVETLLTPPATARGRVVAPLLRGPTSVFSCYLPVATPPGTTAAQLTIYGGGTGKLNYSVYALSSMPTVLLRPDGRTWPVGSHRADASGGNTSGTLIAAPTTPRRILVKSLVVSGAAPTGTSYGVSGTIGGATASIVPGRISANTVTEPLGGILLDPATALKWAATGSGSFVEAVALYDIVV